MHPRERIRFRAEALRAGGRWREPVEVSTPGALVDTRSNDYLGLASRVVSRETPVSRRHRVGAGASRLVSGTLSEHTALEAALAAWVAAESALLFSSAYAANIGCLGALAGPGEIILSDALNHASLIDGCRLSKAEVIVLPHGDCAALERALANTRGVRWVVTEAYFGMDGDTPDLRRIRDLCDRHQAGLFVDEAHALGVFGPEGSGACAEAGIHPDVLVGGLGKAFGLQGGFVACSRELRAWLWNRARSFVFSTAPSPYLCALTSEQLELVRRADRERAQLEDRLRSFESHLRAGGVPLPAGRRGPIFPIILGDEQSVMIAAAELAQRGVLCQPIRPPTVPAGGCRLRVSIRADMREEEVVLIASAIAETWRDRHREGLWAEALAPEEARRALDGETRDAIRSEEASERGGLGGTAANRDVAPRPAAPSSVEVSRLGHVAADAGQDPVRRPAPNSDGVPGKGRLDPGHLHHLGEALVGAEGGSTPGPRGVSSAASGLDFGGPGENGPTQDLGLRVRATENVATVPALTRGASGISRRWLVLGTGTAVGKTFVSRALLALLRERKIPCAGLKPIETGIVPLAEAATTDAGLLQVGSFHVKHPTPHPLYAFPDPVTPALAARNSGAVLDLTRIPGWIASAETQGPNDADTHPDVLPPPCLIIETAGGVFSPLTDTESNLDLARALDPTTWLLVAPNRLGVLHDVLSCLHAMRALGRLPDWIVLSEPDQPDAATSTNAAELRRHPLAPPILELPRHGSATLLPILHPVLSQRPAWP
jgi:8-amino-7-oxononanoate synthase